MRGLGASERGQGTVEYVGLLALLSLLFAGLVVAAGAASPTRLPGLLAGKLLCAVRGSERCAPPAPALEASYGAEIAALLRRHAPQIRFEDGEFVSLPVDFRSCRERSCADSSERGTIGRSFADEPVTAFVRVIDCRGPAPPPGGAECGGERADNLYLQYWLYYPDSATRPWGRKGYHLDDWESYQIRVGADGEVRARASSHGGYNHAGGLRGAPSDLGLIRAGPLQIDAREPAWGPSNGFLWVSAGSHAGRAAGSDPYFRSVRPEQLRLIPLEPALRELDRYSFEVAPPWLKRVWVDPEHTGT